MFKHRKIMVRVPGTTANLGCGFDCMGMALDIFNEFRFEIRDEAGYEVTVQGAGAEELPLDENNLVLSSATMVFDQLGVRPSGLKLEIINNIPLARGLGSSATAIVGGLLGANTLLEHPLSKQELIDLATELEGHPDNVAPAFLGGIVISFQGGKRIWSYRTVPPQGLSVLLVIPEFHLSTSAARSVLPQQVALADAVFNVGRAAYLAAAFSTGHLEGILEAMDDRLHQPYRQKLIPGLADVFNVAKKAGAVGVALSGAGPTVMVITQGVIPDLGAQMKSIFATAGVESEYLWTKPFVHGAICQVLL